MHMHFFLHSACKTTAVEILYTSSDVLEFQAGFATADDETVKMTAQNILTLVLQFSDMEDFLLATREQRVRV